MIVSVHLADLGPRAAAAILRRSPDPATVPGLTYARTVTAAPLSKRLLPVLQPGHVGLIAAWDDDAACDDFCHSHPLAKRLASGWQARLTPLRVFGFWPGMPDLPKQALPIGAQLVAPAEGEPLLLSLAAQLEQAQRWDELSPAV